MCENNHNHPLPRLSKHKDKENEKKVYGKQNYWCKGCGRQFIGDLALSYQGCHSSLTQKILLMPVRGIGIRNISVIENVNEYQL